MPSFCVALFPNCYIQYSLNEPKGQPLFYKKLIKKSHIRGWPLDQQTIYYKNNKGNRGASQKHKLSKQQQAGNVSTADTGVQYTTDAWNSVRGLTSWKHWTFSEERTRHQVGKKNLNKNNDLAPRGQKEHNPQTDGENPQQKQWLINHCKLRENFSNKNNDLA
jgi:hypothetical protein